MSESKDPHLRNRRCALPERYPEPKVQAPNHYYASLLLEDYAGPTSELTAINQYLYHHFTLHHLKDLAELEECIAIIEMKHMELLAETIILLGVDPQFRTLTNNLPAYWSATSVYYGVDACDKLTADISAETQAIKSYRRHQQMIDDPYIKVLLERIIKDEEHHRDLFCDALAKYCPGPR
ncbi:MAG TPA: manganese catalase family protein [Bacillota bacterium]|nr:manganese catalase family protein [Bacillota bacterium]